MMDLVQQNLERSQEARKALSISHTEERAFEIGDVVLTLDPVRRNKMQDIWNGPYEVVERINEVTCNVKRICK